MLGNREGAPPLLLRAGRASASAKPPLERTREKQQQPKFNLSHEDCRKELHCCLPHVTAKGGSSSSCGSLAGAEAD